MVKIKSVSFENYKAFYEKQIMQLKPITILIGKNSSGKSAIAKLFTLLETSLKGDIDEPLLLKNNGVELGADFDNLFFGNDTSGLPLNFQITFENNITIEIGLFKKRYGYGLDVIQWKYKDDKRQFELEFDFKNNAFFDASHKKIYLCKFKGFLLSQIREENTSDTRNLELDKLEIQVDYIGPFRILPNRSFILTGKTKYQYTGVQGENAYAMLGVSKRNHDKLHQDVESWYEKHLDGWKLKVNDDNIPYFEIQLSKNIFRTETMEKVYEQEFPINIVDVGQGIHQALPLVVRANVTDRPDSIIVLEQPELHLHPAAHGDLAELFAKSAKENNQTFLIETHSENIILRLRKLIVENDFGFTKDDLIIYWIEDAELKGKELREITVDEEGVLSDWPEGVFNEGMKEILEMQKALRRKEEQ
jgi:predicted ATPase